jgi:two-component system sensor kinase FixL
MDPIEVLLSYSEKHSARVRVYALAVAVAVAIADWQDPGISLGFLYIIPILLTSSLLNVWQILGVAAACAVLREAFYPSHWGPGSAPRVIVGFLGFALAGYFVSELSKKRHSVLKHLREREEQIRLRQVAERQVRIIVDTSPLAILTLDSSGHVVLANRSAQELLGFDDEPLEGRDVSTLLPILGRVLKTQKPTELRTTLECKVQRLDGDIFLAHIWLSTYLAEDGLGLAAVIWDASENLRDKEGTGLDSMMATSRVVIGALSHEIRNLASAAMSAHRELSTVPAVEQAQPYRALTSVLLGLEKLASSGLALTSDTEPVFAELGTVLDEARILTEPPIREAGGAVSWKIAKDLPLVEADHHGLLQVFLNLARNSQAAIGGGAVKELSVEASVEAEGVIVRFRDSGCGVAHPDSLFRPFQSSGNSAGLGLYISRAILRAHGGDLRYEPQAQGSCFTVELRPVLSPSKI